MPGGLNISVRHALNAVMTGEFSLPSRSGLVSVANAVLTGLHKCALVPEVDLDVQAMCALAREQTGLQDFGDPWFLKPLAVLVEALKEEAALNAIGRFAATGQFLKVMRERLWAQHWFESEREILAEPLEPPVIVVGPMRSGTTRLHRLLAEVGRRLDSRGWAPATAGNYSVRLADGSVAITTSGKHKGRLTADDFMRVDLDGNPLTPGKPSAETEFKNGERSGRNIEWTEAGLPYRERVYDHDHIVSEKNFEAGK